MKRSFGALGAFCAWLPLIVACSSSSSPPPATPDQDSGTNPPTQDGSVTPQQDGSMPVGQDSGGGSSDATTPIGDAKPPPTPDAGPGAAAACASYASTFCSRLGSCSSIGLSAAFGDESTCATRVALTCVGVLAAPGTGATATGTSTCASAIPSVACDPFLVGNLGASCATSAGTVAASGACAFDAQCATKFCAIAPNATCGT